MPTCPDCGVSGKCYCRKRPLLQQSPRQSFGRPASPEPLKEDDHRLKRKLSRLQNMHYINNVYRQPPLRSISPSYPRNKQNIQTRQNLLRNSPTFKQISRPYPPKQLPLAQSNARLAVPVYPSARAVPRACSPKYLTDKRTAELVTRPKESLKEEVRYLRLQRTPQKRREQPRRKGGQYDQIRRELEEMREKLAEAQVAQRRSLRC